MTPDSRHRQDGTDSRTSLEQYLMMNEKEKDIEIQKAIGRLQKRIQEILYTLEAEKEHAAGLEVLQRKN